MLLEGNKTRPAETFCSTRPESFWQPASLCLHRTQREGSEDGVGADIIWPPMNFERGEDTLTD